MKNTIRAKGFGFARRHGLIDIGRNYRLGIWAIELHYGCPYLAISASRLWAGRNRPTRRCIAICTILSPIAMLLHWLFVVPILAVFVSIAAAIVTASVLGAVLAWLGERLERVWRLR